MYRTLKLKYLKALFVLCTIGIMNAEAGDLQPFPVDVFVYDGEGSLLIEWDFPEFINPESITISVKESGENQFTQIAELAPDSHTYLDMNCLPDVRYFYVVSLKDYFGNTFSSDSITPMFGSCLGVEDSSVHNQDFTSIEDIILFSILNEESIDAKDSLISSIFTLFKDETFHTNSWIETFNLSHINQAADRLIDIENLVYDVSLESNIERDELKYRNKLHISPEHWMKHVQSGFSNFKLKWNDFHRAFETNIEILKSLAPIRITHILQSDGGSPSVNLFTFHQDQIQSNEIFLLSGDEYMNVTELQMNSGRTFSVNIPSHWTYVDLMMDDIFIQTCSIIKGESITYTLNGDMIPIEHSQHFKVARQQSSIWLNEIAWNAYTGELNLEVAGTPTFDNHFSIYLNDMLIWDIESQSSFEIQYNDSAFTVTDEFVEPLILSFQREFEGNIQSLEYHVLDSIPTAISRIPDGEHWQYSEYTTLGKSNSVDHELVESTLLPELFVLYQNYPNPFNGQTRITFDLLDDAIISLYITDATGRIHDKFLENEFLMSGTFQYDWSGEGKSTGIYFFTIQAQSGNLTPTIQSRKMIYLK